MSNIVVQTAPVVQCVPPPPHPGAKYVQVYKNLGIAQIVLGGLSIFLAIVSLIIASVGYLDGFAFVSTGIWCDALMLTAGALGIVSAKGPTSCPVRELF